MRDSSAPPRQLRGSARNDVSVIVLAAGVGKRFGRRTKHMPKCLIPLDRKGTCLLSRYLETFRRCGLQDVWIVVGHEKKQILTAARQYGQNLRIHFIENARYREGSLVSLYTARKTLRSGQTCIVMDADVFFPVSVFQKLLRAQSPSAFLYDPRSKSAGEEMMLMGQKGRPYAISKSVAVIHESPLRMRILGEATGIVRWSPNHGKRLAKLLSEFVRKGRTRVEYEEAYDRLLKKVRVGLVPVGNLFWSEMDFEEDLKKIRGRLR